MNQDNNDFELSGTLGSLNDTALDNLTKENASDPVLNEFVEEPEIEFLDVPEQMINEEPHELVQSNDMNLGVGIEPQPVISPIPTNFDIGDIGSVPPIAPKEKKGKKGWFIFLVIIFILIIGALVFYYLRVSKGTLSNAVTTKDLIVEMGEDLPSDINSYATFKSISSNNCILNTEKVNNTAKGEYEYSITCGTKVFKGNITIKDTIAPTVKVKTLVKKVNEEVKPEDFISNCDDVSKCTYSFENKEQVENNLKQTGEYTINIIVNDSSNNKITVTTKLIVMDVNIKVYLNCVLTEQTEDEFDGVVTHINKIAINPDTQYAGLYFNIKEYVANSEEDYFKVKNEYINNKTLIINNGEGTPVFDDVTLMIRFEDALTDNASFGSDYASIKKYYEKQQNYMCNILNAN